LEFTVTASKPGAVREEPSSQTLVPHMSKWEEPAVAQIANPFLHYRREIFLPFLSPGGE
jgi:hypothetical protein